MDIRIVFFGSSIHSLPTLTKLIENGYKIAAVVTKPDSETQTPVAEYAQKNNIPVLKPQSHPLTPWLYKDVKNLVDSLTPFKPDLLVACYYGQKIPIEVIKLARFGGINIHPSLLPKYRGAAPAEWAIANGETETGVTILTLEEEFDQGKIIAQEVIQIEREDNPEILYQNLFKKGAEMLIKILPDFLQGKIELKTQDNSKATAAPRLTRDDGKIDWGKKPVFIERQIRAMSPWPGTFTFININGKKLRLKILKAHLNLDKLIIDEVQLEGKNPVSFEQFKSAYPDFKFV